ncbi:MAG: hypothetical protein LBM13_03665 [Candidatus Ancillula sp.]|nr:hypothetical protein [Candidatus Ancillula sp.]
MTTAIMLIILGSMFVVGLGMLVIGLINKNKWNNSDKFITVAIVLICLSLGLLFGISVLSNIATLGISN